jgi:pimeloyl-ACP methyl ester carboxylesterase
MVVAIRKERLNMKVGFDNPHLSLQLLRIMGNTAWGGADVGECLATAARIKEGDFDSWYAEWSRTGDRVHAWADVLLASGCAQLISARQAYLRAATYHRAAEFYLHGNLADPRIEQQSQKSLACFDAAARLTVPPPRVLDIPYEATHLPAYFYRVDDLGRPRPTLLLQMGFDGTQEELYGLATAATARGWNCLTFEGPGQGQVIREQHLHFRPDWEKVITPVLDHALSRPDVDPMRIALMGLSFGGYLAPRAAAFEPRLAALVANGGVLDFFGNGVPPGMTRQDTVDYMKAEPQEVNLRMKHQMLASIETRWAMENGMFTFGAATVAEYLLKTSQYTLEGVAPRITCPTLIVDSENERTFRGQARQLYDALTCPKEFMLFTADEGAGEHCQVGAAFLSGERIFTWLEKTLGG